MAEIMEPNNGTLGISTRVGCCSWVCCSGMAPAAAATVLLDRVAVESTEAVPAVTADPVVVPDVPVKGQEEEEEEEEKKKALVVVRATVTPGRGAAIIILTTEEVAVAVLANFRRDNDVNNDIVLTFRYLARSEE